MDRHGHFIRYFACGHVESQCRCFDPQKTTMHLPAKCLECIAAEKPNTPPTLLSSERLAEPENTSAPHPCGVRYLDDEGRCLQCGYRHLGAEVTRLDGVVESRDAEILALRALASEQMEKRLNIEKTALLAIADLTRESDENATLRTETADLRRKLDAERAILVDALRPLAAIEVPDEASDGTWVATTIFCGDQVTAYSVRRARAALDGAVSGVVDGGGRAVPSTDTRATSPLPEGAAGHHAVDLPAPARDAPLVAPPGTKNHDLAPPCPKCGSDRYWSDYWTDELTPICVPCRRPVPPALPPGAPGETKDVVAEAKERWKRDAPRRARLAERLFGGPEMPASPATFEDDDNPPDGLASRSKRGDLGVATPGVLRPPFSGGSPSPLPPSEAPAGERGDVGLPTPEEVVAKFNVGQGPWLRYAITELLTERDAQHATRREQEAAEQTRERCAKVAEERTRDRWMNVSWPKQAEEAGRVIAAAIRALPLEDTP